MPCAFSTLKARPRGPPARLIRCCRIGGASTHPPAPAAPPQLLLPAGGCGLQNGRAGGRYLCTAGEAAAPAGGSGDGGRRHSLAAGPPGGLHARRAPPRLLAAGRPDPKEQQGRKEAARPARRHRHVYSAMLFGRLPDFEQAVGGLRRADDAPMRWPPRQLGCQFLQPCTLPFKPSEPGSAADLSGGRARWGAGWSS